MRKYIEAIIEDRIYDNLKAKSEMMYKPEVTMSEGIRKVVKWYIQTGLL